MRIRFGYGVGWGLNCRKTSLCLRSAAKNIFIRGLKRERPSTGCYVGKVEKLSLTKVISEEEARREGKKLSRNVGN